MTKKANWISTGQAAAMVDYDPDAFRRKFFEAFKRQKAVFRIGGGNCRWDPVIVARLRADEEDVPNAG